MFLSREEVRNLDRQAIKEFGVPGSVLMENAGKGTADLLLALGPCSLVIVCCGKGNNGGDGFVIARHLDNWDIPTRIFLFERPENLGGDAAIHYQIAAKAGIPMQILPGPQLDEKSLRADLTSADWIVDALLGTGLTGPPRAPLDQAIEVINSSPCRVLAVDLPSGLDCNTGLPLGTCIRADHTATFVAVKQGFANPESKKWIGKVHVIDIGMPKCLLQLQTRNGIMDCFANF